MLVLGCIIAWLLIGAGNVYLVGKIDKILSADTEAPLGLLFLFGPLGSVPVVCVYLLAFLSSTPYRGSSEGFLEKLYKLGNK